MASGLRLQAPPAASGLCGKSFGDFEGRRNASFTRSGIFGENVLASVRRSVPSRGGCGDGASPGLACVAMLWWSDAAIRLQPRWQKAHLMRVEKLKAGSVSKDVLEDEVEIDYISMLTELSKSRTKQLISAGLTPEMIIGRAAMLGFLAATTVEFETGKSVLQQLTIRGELSSAVVVVTVALLSLLLHENNSKENGSSAPFNPFGLFTPTAERLNGQAAMLGFVLLVAIESAKGSALF
ncbi:hypothetical protein Mapa_004126 [Marchantia paleacea]|nr:hypothetical protein Mapa_004126 [Marchantia paleacea]